MGSRMQRWCVLSAALLAPGVARAEDIGHEPMAPVPPVATTPAAPTPEARGPTPGTPRPAMSDQAGAAGPRRRWYGWQTLLVDVIPVVGILGVTSQTRDRTQSDSIVIFTGTYLVGAPIVHAVHGHAGKAALSLAIRAIAPLLIAAGVSEGKSTDTGSSDESGVIFLAVTGALAVPAAIAVDAAAIAREDVPSETSAAFVQDLGISPWLNHRRGAGGVALSGHF